MHKTLRQREAALDARLGVRTCAISMGSDAPDNSGLNAAAVQQAALSKEQLDWAKQMYQETAPQRAETQQRQNAVSDQQLRLGNKQEALTDEANARYKSTFQPVEDKLVQEAQSYDTPERREQAAAEAMNGVDEQSALAMGGVKRDLADMGTDASSGAAAIALSRVGLAQGAARAAQGNAARKLVEATGHGYMADAANMGRGIATQQGQTASLALNAANSAGASSAGANGTGMSGAALMNSGYSGAQSGLAGAAGTYGTIGRINADAASADAAGMAGIGKLVGGAAGFMLGGPAGAMAGATMMSDKNEKEGIEPADDDVALSSVRKMPVSRWKYKADSVAADGGREHVGPMAQDVHAAAGEAVAPGGKQIDLVSMNGVTLSAVRALDKKVTALDKKVHGKGHHGRRSSSSHEGVTDAEIKLRPAR